MFTEKNFDGGILGLLKTNINSNPHYLVNAKFEPGNYKFIQLSPTVQATFSNINKMHGGSDVKFLNFFKSPKKNKCRIIFRQWVSEEGGRLRNKRNLGHGATAPASGSLQPPKPSVVRRQMERSDAWSINVLKRD